jgi:hypothetical protein
LESRNSHFVLFLYIFFFFFFFFLWKHSSMFYKYLKWSIVLKRHNIHNIYTVKFSWEWHFPRITKKLLSQANKRLCYHPALHAWPAISIGTVIHHEHHQWWSHTYFNSCHLFVMPTVTIWKVSFPPILPFAGPISGKST